MRGIGHTLSRLPVARALIAGAAILAGAFAPAAQAQAPAQNGQGDEAAMAIPRVVPQGNPRGDGGAPLPQPLAPSEAARIRRIFALQGRGQVAAATRETASLGDTLLLGHILADRYLGPYHRATPDELRAWLDRFAGLPDAPAIHALLARRLPKDAVLPPAPVLDELPETEADAPAPEDSDQGASAIPPNRLLDRTVAQTE
jgi:hypothetical protein